MRLTGIGIQAWVSAIAKGRDFLAERHACGGAVVKPAVRPRPFNGWDVGGIEIKQRLKMGDHIRHGALSAGTIVAIVEAVGHLAIGGPVFGQVKVGPGSHCF